MFRNRHFRQRHFKSRHLQLGIIQTIVEYVVARAGFCHDAVINSFLAVNPIRTVARQAINRLFDKEYAPTQELNREQSERDLTQGTILINLGSKEVNMEIKVDGERVPEEIGSRTGVFEYIKYLGNTIFNRIRSWR